MTRNISEWHLPLLATLPRRRIQILLVVAERVAVAVGDRAAGLGQHHLGRAGVPFHLGGRQVQHGVDLAARQRHVLGGRAHLHGARRQPRRRQALAQPFVGVEARDADAHVARLLQARCAQLARRPVDFDERAAAAQGEVQRVLHRLVGDAQHRRAVDRQTDEHAEVAGLRQEVARAVERVDDPDAPLAEGVTVVRATPRSGTRRRGTRRGSASPALVRRLVGGASPATGRAWCAARRRPDRRNA